MISPDDTRPRPSWARRGLVLGAAFLGWMFAGLCMSILPLVVRPAVLDFIGAGTIRVPAEVAAAGADSDAWAKWAEERAVEWLAWYTCAFLLGAAAGGAAFGWCGDRVGRTRAMALSVLCYSLVTGVSYWCRDPVSLLVLRFVACLGIGGMWPNGVALVAEVWPDVSRPLLAGLIGTAANLGFVALGLLGLWVRITLDSWRWVLLVGAAPALLGLTTLLVVPESRRWLAERGKEVKSRGPSPVREIFGPSLRYATLVGICLGTVPVVGNWGGANWIIPWTDQAVGKAEPHRKAVAQITRSSGAALGSLIGGWLASRFGRRLTYFGISLACLLSSAVIYHGLKPTDRSFGFWVFVLGFVGVAYYGWLPLYLPELFPTRVRSTGTGVAFNFGRVLAAPCVLGAGALGRAFHGDYAKIGAVTSLVYVFGMLAAFAAPDTSKRKLSD